MGDGTRSEVFKWLKSMFRRKKKGENAEPSSPKVTCIGQVRVKSKREGKGKRLRSRSKRRVSFRQEQRWVQLPVTICRAFGADRNCLLPCRSTTTCCGPRWLLPRQIQVEKHTIESHVFEDIDIEAQGFEACAPPKNALLLMRCRSHPFKMANQSYHQHTNVKHLQPDGVIQEPDLNLTVYESNLGKQETEALAPAKPTDSQFLLNQDMIEDTTESEPESETQVLEEVAVVTREEQECLMLMMYEPKVSMEVSRETWVCTTDFIRRLPLQDEPKKRIQQAPRSSCSYPARPPKGMELTRCKSEPKGSPSKLAPEIDPHRPQIGNLVWM